MPLKGWLFFLAPSLTLAGAGFALFRYGRRGLPWVAAALVVLTVAAILLYPVIYDTGGPGTFCDGPNPSPPC